LDNNTEGKQYLGYKFLDKDGSGSQLIVNKMAKVFKLGRLWSKGRDGKLHLAPSDIFTCKEDLLSVIKGYCVEQGISLRKVRNDSKRYTQKCSNLACTFRLHAFVLVDKTTWMVRSLRGSHVCALIEANKVAGSTRVATHLLADFKYNPDMDANGIQQTIMARYTVHIRKYTCWRARKLMKEVVEGKHDEGYRVLPQYMEVFKEKNPELVCLINWTNQGPTKNPTFKRCTICVRIAIAAFKEHCRPLIGIDACFLKDPYKGVLMTAMGLDGNNGQFPLTCGVAPCENEEEWSSFIHALAVALGATENSSKYTFISDRLMVSKGVIYSNLMHLLWMFVTDFLFVVKGIINALRKIMPQAARKIYVFHFYKNFASNFPSKYANLTFQ